MNKRIFLEVVNIGASCLAPGEPSRHLLDMLWKRLETFSDDLPNLIKLMMPVKPPKSGSLTETRTIDSYWLGKFCTSLYDGLTVLELEAEAYIPPPPPEPEPKPNTTLTVGELKEALSKFDDDRCVHVVTYIVYSDYTTTEKNHDITGVFGDEWEIQIQFDD